MMHHYNDMISGEIKEIFENGSTKSILIVDEEGMEYVFHINDYTIVITFESLNVGDTVDVIFNGILTASLPPQGSAIIVNGLTV